MDWYIISYSRPMIVPSELDAIKIKLCATYGINYALKMSKYAPN